MATIYGDKESCCPNAAETEKEGKHRERARERESKRERERNSRRAAR
jgi:hypothetical protein